MRLLNRILPNKKKKPKYPPKMVPDVGPLVEPLGTLAALEAVLHHLVRLHHVGLHLLSRNLLPKLG